MEASLIWIVAISLAVAAGLALRWVAGRVAANAEGRRLHRERFRMHAERALDSGALTDRDLGLIALYAEIIDTADGRDFMIQAVERVLQNSREGIVPRPGHETCLDAYMTTYHVIRNLSHVGLLKGMILERKLLAVLDQDKDPADTRDYLGPIMARRHLTAS
ncbi:hypothetical protein SAMN05421508_102557 [Caenispirillum bisanense]|uniref:Uncharacterized protein n=1 Tax=Caenispirillum bisanense TaxID=414052 RepID=A0A286GB08_9PROT|nr:hypothetical protein SAMN05421508_102557 [Caenispirillum bisanense]